MENKGEIIIYQAEDGESQLDIRLENETLWLSLAQMVQLFDRDKSVISRHIANLFKEGELNENSVVAFFATTAADGKTYQVENFNLDVIISIGYRVNSKRGTQFRMWATRTLKEHLVKGYTINEKRLLEQHEKLKELQDAINLIKYSVSDKQIGSDEAKGLLDIISQYTRSFILLNQFDNNTLETDLQNEKLTFEINEPEALIAIAELKKELIKKKEASNLFGKQKDDSFKGILYSVVQTFGGLIYIRA